MKKLAVAVLLLSGAIAFAAAPTTTDNIEQQIPGAGGPGHGGPGHGQPGNPGQPGGPGHGQPQPPHQPPPQPQPPHQPPPQPQPPHQPPGWGQPPHQPQPPQQPPGWGQDYGPGVTRRWADLGTFKAPKVVQQDVTINTNNALVNELILRVNNAQIDISSVWVYLYSGQVIELRQLNGRFNPGNELRARLDFNYSLRVSRIVLRVSSPQVVGPSAKVQTLLGLAQ
jgi:hypothetical protein